jgi:hypothetical protein
MKSKYAGLILLFSLATYFAIGLWVIASDEPPPNCTAANPADCVPELLCPDGILCCVCCNRTVKYDDDFTIRLHLGHGDTCGWCEGDMVLRCKHGTVIARREVE